LALLGLGVLLVVLDVRLPLPFGALDLLADVAGWGVAYVAAGRLAAGGDPGFRSVTVGVLILGAWSLTDVVVPTGALVLELVQQAYGVAAVVLFMIMAIAVQARAQRGGGGRDGQRFALHRQLLAVAMLPGLAGLYLLIADADPNPVTVVAAFVGLTFGFLAQLWFVVDLNRSAGRDWAV
jgi:hypothetical protein